MKNGSYLLIISLMLATFGILTYFYTLEPQIVQANILISRWLQENMRFLTSPLRVISTIEYFILPAAYVFPIYFFIKKQRLLTSITFIAASSWIMGRLLKEFFLGPCPGSDVVDHLYPMLGNLEMFFRTQCFPSGHVFDYTSILGMIFFLNIRVFKKQKIGVVTNILIIVLISTVGLSRVMLGAHWLTDVIAGYLFGGAWVTLLIYFYRQLAKRHMPM